MAQINIDGKEYDVDSFSQEGKATLLSLQFVQGELNKLNAQIAVFKTAEVSYKKSLKDHIDSISE
tara:strand:- start:224 stop:418 length:195 start_codon:yes stop_codon:yes gene_type:complete